MNQDILLSKIIPNSTDTTWAQAYTTLNVYITLSIENPASSSITSYGKDLLEKLQREFFALDEKSLDNIKKAVRNVSSQIDDSYKYSILVGTLVKNIFYIVIAGDGQVIIKREGKIGVIARGVEGQLHGFSGKLKHDDVVILETADFAQKMPQSKIEEYLSSSDVSQIAENITPLVHNEPKGTEAAIVLQYKDMEGLSDTFSDLQDQEQEIEESEEQNDTPQNLWTKTPVEENRNIEELADDQHQEEEDQESIITAPFETHSKKRFSFNFTFLKFTKINKRSIIVIAIICLVVILAVSLTLENNKKLDAARKAAFEKIYNPAKEQFEEGDSLLTLNKSLAFEKLASSQKLIKDNLSNFPKDSSEYQQLSDLLSKVENEIKQTGGGSSAKNIIPILKESSRLKSISSVTYKGGKIIVSSLDDKKTAIVDTDGSIEKTFDTKGVSPQFITADDKFIYAYDGTKISQIDKGNGNAKVIVDSASGISFDTFDSNLYVLNNNSIDKYKSPSYQKSSYLNSKANFASTPIDMSISGPIYVLEQNGDIESFTKGNKDSFSVSGLKSPVSSTSHIYTDSDFNNIYILDPKNQRVVVLNNKGEFQNQYEGDFLKNSKSFAIDEKDKKGYVVSNNVLYSFDL